MISYRWIQSTDAQELQQLIGDELGYAVEEEAVNEWISTIRNQSSDFLLGAFSQGRLIGFVHASLYQTLFAPLLTNVLGLAVMESFKRRGIGQELMMQVERWSRTQGSQGIRVNSDVKRKDAHAFYQSIGYTYIKDQANFRKYLIDIE